MKRSILAAALILAMLPTLVSAQPPQQWVQGCYLPFGGVSLSVRTCNLLHLPLYWFWK